MTYRMARMVGVVVVAFATIGASVAWAGGPPPGGGGGGGGAPSPRLFDVHLETKTLTQGDGQLTVMYIEPAAGKTTATIEKQETGVKVGSKCRPPQDVQQQSVGLPCKRLVEISSATHSDNSGLNTFRIPKRATHRLRKGTYKLALVARAAGKVSATKTFSFKVI